MDTSKILTASMLDLLFEGRNKAYGAYELRKTYPKRILKSWLIMVSLAGLVYAGAVLARSSVSNQGNPIHFSEVVIQSLPEDKQPEKIPDPPQQQSQVRTEIFTPPVIVDKEKVENPPPTMDDLDSARIGLIKVEGVSDNRLSSVIPVEDNRGIIDDTRKEKNDGPLEIVQIEAKYAGNWESFLRKNLNPSVPADNGAPAGQYKVVIQFVVDVDGNVSDITPLTHVGYGMEQEAMRVLKKAAKWEPAFQNGIHVKAYRRQPIIFDVIGED
jgi:protein TonB